MFTKNIVLEAVRPYRGSHYIATDAKPMFRWVAMLPGSPDEMEHDMLYICMLSEAIDRNLKKPGYVYLCIRDRFTDDDEDANALSGVIVMNENKDIAWLFNIIQKRFLEISEWANKMRDALIENCDYQALTDLCEPILNNFVSVFDSSYTLLAHTKNIICHDPVNIELMKRGYHTDETLQKFREKRRFEVYEQEQGVVISAPGVIAQYEIVTKWCRYGGEMLLQVVMECSQTPLSLAAVDLFEIFMDHIQICFLRQQRANPSQIYSSLLNEMLYGELENPFIIGERSKTADIPFSGLFNVYRIVFEDNSTVLIGRFVQELMAYLPKSKIIAHKYEIIILNNFNPAKIQEQSSHNLSKLTPLLEKYGAMCGVSEMFNSLPELKNAYIQATRAQTLGVQLRTLGNFWNFDRDVFEATAIENNSNIFYFNDVYIYLALHFAQSGTFDAFGNSSQNKTLKKLLEYDADNNTHLVQVLYAYLVSERRATAAGRLLRMHRNNVLYHISRIEEITGIDLNDYWTRLKLALAFHFFELQESNRLFFNPGGD
ncbi:MAG: helix-turn-helix domain-containing protein, partial [Oscillospiraceae bacterium]|nr:helix-turn-helix domain-containing protein [Oscillospiraceae bacterium]